MSSDNKFGISRRSFIAGVSAGVALGASCSSKERKKEPGSAGKAVTPASLADALPALLLLVGPWLASDRGVADEFIARFLTEKRMA
jgi:hypothetical protein